MILTELSLIFTLGLYLLHFINITLFTTKKCIKMYPDPKQNIMSL